MPVIFFHAGIEPFSGGFVGVDVFFVISGYLITSLILSEKAAGTFSLAQFYERRARRILPALFLVVAACIPFAWFWLLPDEMKEFSRSVAAIPVFASNFLFWQESGYFDRAAELKPLLHTWSLAVEEQYYLLFPLFILLVWKAEKRWAIGLLAAATVGSLALAQWGAYHEPAAAFFLLPTRIWELGIGALIAFYLARTQTTTAGGTALQILSVTGLLLILFAVFAFDKATPFPGIYGLIPTLGAALIILFAMPSTLVGSLLGSSAFVGVGLISYSAYLWHQPLLVFARYKDFIGQGQWRLLLLIVVCMALAFLSWRLVESPFRRKTFLNRKTIFAFAAAASIGFFVFGLAGSHSDGFPDRLKDQSALKVQELINVESAKRRKATQVGVCHFNHKKIGQVDDFLARWNCGAGHDTNLKSIGVAVTGDSHSADVAIALKQNGISPLQLGGNGCSLVPRFATKNCAKIFDRVRREIVGNENYTHIFLANRFQDHELSVDSVKEMIDFWKGFGKEVVLFVGMPNFPKFKELLGRGRLPKFDRGLSNQSKRDELMQLYSASGIHVIDRDEFFCSINQCSPFGVNGELLLLEDTHLTVKGAELFGRALLAREPVLGRLIKR